MRARIARAVEMAMASSAARERPARVGVGGMGCGVEETVEMVRMTEPGVALAGVGALEVAVRRRRTSLSVDCQTTWMTSA